MKKLLIIITIFCLLVNPAWATNTHTTVLANASNQYWSIADASQTGLEPGSNDFTIEMWIYADTLPNTINYILSKEDIINRSYSIFVRNTGVITARYTDTGNNSTIFDSDSSQVATGTWTHLAFVFNVSTATIDMYVNGSGVAETATSTDATSVDNTANEAYKIGATLNSAAISNSFDGWIDNVRHWSDARTAQEISDNYNCSLIGNEANLEGYWKFDNSGNDATSNGNNLTNNNSATFQSASLPFTNSCSAITSSSFRPIIFD